MWNTRKSASLSVVAVYVCIVAFALLLLFAPYLLKLYFNLTSRPSDICTIALMGLYAIAFPIGMALIQLLKLLYNIKADKVFTMQNVMLLRHISWDCFAVALVAFFAGFFYIPFFIIFAASAFMGLVLRVVKNVMAAATEIKSENELTI